MTGGGATGAVGSRGDGRRVYRDCGDQGGWEEGLQGPWGPRMTGGGATGTVGTKGDGRRGYRGHGGQG